MLHPKKGEGEHRNKATTTTKGPLIFTAALLFCYPICLAEVALAQEHSLIKPTSSYGLQRLGLNQQPLGLGTLKGIQPKNYPSLSLLASETPSVEDINKLKSSIQRLETQLDTLLLTSRNPNSPQVQKAIEVLTEDIATAKSRLQAAETAINSFTQAQLTLQAIVKRYEAAQARVEAAQKAEEEAKQVYDAKVSQLSTSSLELESARTAYTEAQTNLTTAEQSFNEADAAMTQQLASKNQAYNNLQARQGEASTAASTLEAAEQTAANAQQDVNEAQHDYDTNLIPDPTYVAPTYQQQRTRQVPRTTTQLTGGLTTKVYDRRGYNEAPPMPSANETPLSTQTVTHVDFIWDYVLNSGRNEDVIVEFTGYISPTTSGYYRFYTPADDGTKLYINNQLIIDDWYDKGGGGSVSAPIYLEADTPVPVTLYYYENGGGAAVSFYYYTPSQGYQIVPAAWLGTQTQTTTTYITETYYTTEPVISEQTINVNIIEGGEATFNAPAGSTFTSSNLRYESYDNPQCGTNIYPQVNGRSSVTLQADNSIYGDPCGGQVKRITGTLTYVGPPPAPLIKNPTLLAILNNKKSYLVTAQSNLSSAQSANTTAQSNLQAAQQTFNEASGSYVAAQASKETAASNLQSATTLNEAAAQTKTSAEATYEQSVAQKTEAETYLATTSNEVATQRASLSQEEATKTEAETELVTTSNEAQTNFTAAKTSQEAITLTEVDVAIQESNKEAPAETGSEDLPAEITADTLLATDLTQVDPTEMTEEQAEQLKEAALEVFLTADPGSEEYEQALDALFLAAEQDDIVLDPQLAAIPGLAAATELINFFGNAGADMSPERREESKKVVVTAVVAAGAAIQSAAAAAATASGGTTRR